MNASKHIRNIVLTVLLGGLAGCGGGGGGSAVSDGMQPGPQPGPETCPSGQVGTPPNCTTAPPIDPSSTLEWLFPPTAPASSDARAATLAGWNRSARGPFGTVSHSFGNLPPLGISGCCSLVYAAGTVSVLEWGFWARDDLHPGIIKIQRRPAPGEYRIGPHSGSTRLLAGLMEYGTFVIGENTRSFGATFTVNSVNEIKSYARFRDYSHIFHLNATWRGDAFAMEKATRFPVAGPAELRITSVDTRERGKYGLAFTAWLDNGGDTDTVRIDVASETLNSREDDELFHGPFRFSFEGPSAEEVLGIFQDDRYFGSFGLLKAE